jgi:cytochrome c oxidase subunit 2
MLLAAGECSPQNLSIFAPASSATHSTVNLAILIFAITGFIFLIVEGVLIYSLRRFRLRPTDPSSEPPQVYGSMPIEIAWTAAPLLVVLIIILVSARTLWDVEVDPPEPAAGDGALFVTVVGRQWWWEYRYETYDGRSLGFITANELHLPLSTAQQPHPAYLALKSADVYHSFWVPRLAGKVALVPGKTNPLRLTADAAGTYYGQCAEYCGTQHANMLLRVIVQTPEEFEKWLAAQAEPAAEEPSAAAGKRAFLAQSCVSCHRIAGTTARGTYAPDLTHLMSRETLAGGMIENDPAGKNLRAWIADPQKIKIGCLMPSFSLKENALNEIVNYLTTLR